MDTRSAPRSNIVNVAVIGGEGIGPEVTAEARRVLSWFVERRAFVGPVGRR